MKYHEKLLPNQYANSNLYTDETPLEERIYTSILDVIDSNEISPTELECHPDFNLEDMSSSPVYRNFFGNLIHIRPYKSILEIGTFMGLTTIFLSNNAGEDGSVTTIEKFSEFAEIAQRNIDRHCLYNNVTLINNNALNEIENMRDNACLFDFIFLDGNKESYYQYLPILDNMLLPGGTIVVDDIFFHGDALNDSPKTHKGLGVKKVLQDANKYTNYKRSVIPHGNGCLLLTKQH